MAVVNKFVMEAEITNDAELCSICRTEEQPCYGVLVAHQAFPNIQKHTNPSNGRSAQAVVIDSQKVPVKAFLKDILPVFIQRS